MSRVDLLRDEIVRVDDPGDRAENRDLADWVREAKGKGKPIPEPDKSRRAEGPCRLCRDRPARHVCVHCRRDVCREDYWTMLGLCRDCVTDEDLARAAREDRPAPDLGIKWVED